MIKLLFFYFFFIFSLIGFGYLLAKILFKKIILTLPELGLLGILCISFLVTFLHFFISINYYVNFTLYLVGFLIFIINNKIIFDDHIKNLNKQILIFSTISIIGLTMFFGFNPNEDFSYYHLPYIINFTNERIIFGLSNLQINQGWNSIWLNFTSSFYILKNDYKTIHIVNLIFFNFITWLFISKIFDNQKNKNNLTIFFCFTFLCFFVIKFSRFNSYGIDVTSNFLVIVSLIYFFQFFENKNSRNNFEFFLLFAIFSVMMRVSNSFIPLLSLVLLYRLNFNLKKIISPTVIFVSFFFSIWILQQFIYYSCIFIPLKYTCFETSWFDSNIIETFKNNTLYVNKSYQIYSGPLTKDEYFSGLNWVPTWFQRHKIEITEYMMAFLLPLFFMAILLNKQKFKKKILQINFNINSLLIIFFLSSTIWFLSSPVIRLGNHFIFILIFLIMLRLNIFHFLFLGKIHNKHFFIILFISFIFVFLKNIKRINTDVKYLNISRPFPIHLNITTKKEINKDINLYSVIPQKNKGIKYRHCWETKPMCSMNGFDKLIIQKKHGYIFISKPDI